ncbi:MAG: hypothetical protein WCI04_07570 [archaeon]
MKKGWTRTIAVLSGIFAIVIICVIVYNVITDYAIELMFKASQQSLIAQNELEYKKQTDQIIKDYQEQLMLLEKQKLLSIKEKQEQEKLLKLEEEKKLQKLNELKQASVIPSAAKIPADIKSQVMALALKRLGADGVSKCMAMLSGGITPEEKTELKNLFNTRFTASEKKQILAWAAKY